MPNVLVVDDSVSVASAVARALTSRGIDVFRVASGADAMAHMREAAPDLVVCDVILPDMDGYKLCQFVRDELGLRHTPVLLMSGIVDGSVLARAAEVRSSDVIRKPFAADQLQAKVDALLGLAANAGASPRAPAPGVDGFSAGALPPEEDAKSVLARLAAVGGVALAALVDREGYLIESAGDMVLEAETAAALAASLAEAAEGVGRELSQGGLTSLVAEFDTGILLVNAAGPGTLLATAVYDPAVLGKVRYHVKQMLPDLYRVA